MFITTAKATVQTNFRLQFAPVPSMSGHRWVISCQEGQPTLSGSILLNVIPLKLVCQRRNYSLIHLQAAGQSSGQSWHCGSTGEVSEKHSSVFNPNILEIMKGFRNHTSSQAEENSHSSGQNFKSVIEADGPWQRILQLCSPDKFPLRKGCSQVCLYSCTCTTTTKVFLLQGLLLLLPGETFCLPVQSLLLNYKSLCSWEKEFPVTVPQSL